MPPAAAVAKRACKLAAAKAQEFGRLGKPNESLKYLQATLRAQPVVVRKPTSSPALSHVSSLPTSSLSSSSSSSAPSAPSASSASSASSPSSPLYAAASGSGTTSSPGVLPAEASSSAPSRAPKQNELVRSVPMELLPHRYRNKDEESIQRAVTGVIQAFNNSNQTHAATDFASRALRLPNFLPAKVKLPHRVRRVLALLPPISVSTLHYKALLECAARRRSAKMARSILVDMLSRGLIVNGRIRHGLSRLVFSTVNDDTSHMRRAFRRIFSRAQARVKAAEDGEQRSASVADGRLKKIVDLLESLGLMDKVVLQKASKLAKAGQKRMEEQKAREDATAAEASQARAAMHRWMVDDDSAPLSDIPHEYIGPLEEVMDLSQPLASSAYAMRMRVFAVVRRDFEAAQRLWRSMLEHGIAPNMMHVAPLIEGLLAASRIDDAQKLKDNAMLIYGLKPSLRVHTAMIRAYARSGDQKRLEGELKELKENGYQADEVILQILDTAHSHRAPLKVIDRPVDLHDLHSVTSRFSVLLRSRAYLPAQELLQRALDNGLLADDLLRQQLKRSINWMQKPEHLSEGNSYQAPLPEPDTQLDAALTLARQNLAKLDQAHKQKTLVRRAQMRKTRRDVIEVLLELADGSLKNEAQRVALRRRGGTDKDALGRNKQDRTRTAQDEVGERKGVSSSTEVSTGRVEIRTPQVANTLDELGPKS